MDTHDSTLPALPAISFHFIAAQSTGDEALRSGVPPSNVSSIRASPIRRMRLSGRFPIGPMACGGRWVHETAWGSTVVSGLQWTDRLRGFDFPAGATFS